MERLVIIDHAAHQVYIEDVDENVLQERYNGSEEDYIKDMYNLEGDWSWDYVTDVVYYPNDNDDPITVDFEKVLKNC